MRDGGEAFVVLAPQCHIAGTITFADRFRAAVAEARSSVYSTVLRATLSVDVP